MLIILLWILLQTSFFQNFLVRRVTKNLSKNLNTTVNIRHVDFQLFDKMLLEGTLVLDRKNDTLLYAGAVKVSITDWFFFRDQIVLKYIGLEDATINLNRHDSVWNYQFLADYLSSPTKSTDTSSTPAINLDLKKLSLKNVRVWQQDEWKGINMLGSVTELSLDAKRMDLENKIIEINSISLNRPVYSQYDYKGRRPKRPPSTVPSPEIKKPEGLQWNPDGWKMNIKEITLKDGMAAVEREGGGQPEPGLFDERHIILSEIKGSFKNFKLVDDSITARVSISGKDRGDFVIKTLDADYKLTPEIMEFKNLDLVTSKSHLKNYFAMHYKSFNSDMQDFVHAVTLDGHFLDSKLSSDDLAYFAPEIKSWKQVFLLNGTAHGKVDNITAKNMVISAGENNYLEGNLSLRGLPDVSETFIDFRAKELRTSYNELAKIIPDLKGITTPRISTFGNIKFVGSFTGYVRDFVAYGNLSTEIGELQMDLHLQVPEKGKASYQGTLST